MIKSTILVVLIGILLGTAISPGAGAQTDSPSTEAGSGPHMVVTLTLVPKTSAGEKLGRPVTAATVITVVPGDTYLYQLSCENTGDAPARDFRVSIPIAEGEEYLADTASADSAVVSFSIDEGVTFQLPPVTYLLELSDGTMQEQIAPAAMYTTIRWLFTGLIGPGEVRTASFEVIHK